jgi:hypothetical protein
MAEAEFWGLIAAPSLIVADRGSRIGVCVQVLETRHRCDHGILRYGPSDIELSVSSIMKPGGS